MSTRRILVVQSPTSAVDLRGCLQAANWSVHHAWTLADAAEACGSKIYPLGLVVLDSAELLNPAALQHLAPAGGMEWVAVLTTETLRDPRVAQLVAERFYDFHSLPLDPERLLIVLGHALGKVELSRSVQAEPVLDARYGMLGRSPRMREVYRVLDKVVRVDAPVLISGESGTGKEIAARAIHHHSTRSSGPFIPINCGSLPGSLIHSELFGHERGSFTGAHQRKIGSIEAAAGGVIFLDEIGDLPLDLQASLLRFLQEKTIVRVGSTRAIPVDVRVVAATHMDLAAAVRRGRFREDLYYRLNVLHIGLPALRERVEDIPLLAFATFREICAQGGLGVRGFSAEALAAMSAHGWPGNVRELINRVQKATIMSDTRFIMPRDLGLEPHVRATESISLENARALVERDVIHQTLQRNQHNVAATARQLGVSRVTLYRMMQRFDISYRPSNLHSRAE